MPGLVTNAEHVVTGISDIHITQLNQSREFGRPCECLGEVFTTETNFANVKITHSMIGVTRRSKASGRFRQIALGLNCLGEKQMSLLNNTSDT